MSDRAWREYREAGPLEPISRLEWRTGRRPSDLIPDPLERILFVPDTHVPFHDEQAWQLMLRAARRFKPNRIVVLGDLFDFYSVSAHSKDPKRKLSLADEIQAGNAKLDELDSLGAKTKQFACGNHEFRLTRFLADNAGALATLPGLNIESLFKLTERGWNFFPYRTHFPIGKYLYVTHDCGNAGAQAHVKARASFEGSVILGHTHRSSLDYRGNAQGEPHAAIMCGWLGDITQIDYMHAITAQQWQLGFAIGYLEPDDTFHVNLCPIIRNKVLVAGELIV